MKRLALLGLLLAACATSPPAVHTPSNVVWTERVELRLNDVFAAEAIEVRPVRIEMHSAIIYVRSRGIAQNVELRTGLANSWVVAPYSIELLETTIRPTVKLQITRLQ